MNFHGSEPNCSRDLQRACSVIPVVSPPRCRHDATVFLNLLTACPIVSTAAAQEAIAVTLPGAVFDSA